MRKRILKTLAMLGLSACILVGSAVSGFAADAPDKKEECKEDKHEWTTVVEYRDDCVPTEFQTSAGKIVLCPHCGKEGKKDPVECLSLVKNTFSNFSNLKIYSGTLENDQKVMTVAFYYPTRIETDVCTKCDKVGAKRTYDARVMKFGVTANIEMPAEVLNGYTMMLVQADGSETPVEYLVSENGKKAFFQLDMTMGAQLIHLVPKA